MKKILSYVGLGLLVVVAGVLIWSYSLFNGYKPSKPAGEVKQANLGYFLDGYDECRDAFRAMGTELGQKFEGVELFDVPVPAPGHSKSLTVDFCLIPAQDTADVLLVVSGGIHGVEGFTGTAVQLMLMKELLKSDWLSDHGILLINGMNPYGFDVIRRVTQNNVDLNRNCDPSLKVYNTVNEGYRDLFDFINPDGEARPGSLSNRFFYVRAIAKIIESSMPVLRQAVLQGQYEYPEGLYFGGKTPEPQIEMLAPVFSAIPASYQKIIHIDLHTGYGENAKLHLFPNPPKSEEVRQMTEELFAGYDIDWGDSDDFYTVTGEFTSLMGHYQPDKKIVPMTFEFGTLDSQTTMGSLVSIHNMILENQGVQHGFASEKAEVKIKNRIREMYYPSDPLWRSLVIDQSREMFTVLMERL